MLPEHLEAPPARVEGLSQGVVAGVELAALNAARYNHGAATSGDVIFVVGGLDADGTTLSSVVALDLSVDGASWEEKAPLPPARYSLAVAAAGTRLCAGGGYGALGTLRSTRARRTAGAPPRRCRRRA